VAFPNQGTLSVWFGRRAITIALAAMLGVRAFAQQPASPSDAAKGVAYRPADPLNASAFDRF